MSEITLSAGVRQNLLSLQGTADMMSQTQNRLATGKKVNSALDNPTNFFTSQSLQSRSNDLSSLLDAMSNGIKTLEAADNGLTSMTKTLETMQATLRQARQDASFQTSSFELGLGENLQGTETLDFSGGALGGPASVGLTQEVAGATAAAMTGEEFSNIDFADSTAATATAGAYDSVDLETGTAAQQTGDGFNDLDLTGDGTPSVMGTDGLELSDFDGTARNMTLEWNGEVINITVDTDHSGGALGDVVADIQGQIDDALEALGYDNTGNTYIEVSLDANDDELTFTENVNTGSNLRMLGDGEFGITGGGDESHFGEPDDRAAVSFDLTIDGEQMSISLDAFTLNSDGESAWDNTLTGIDAETVASVINAQIHENLGTDPADFTYVEADGAELVFHSSTTGEDSTLVIDNLDATDGFTSGGGSLWTTIGGDDGENGSISFEIAIDGNDPVEVTLDADTVADFADDLSNVSSSELAAAINAQINEELETEGVEYASVNANGNLVFTSATTGDDSTLVMTSNAVVEGGAGDSGLNALDGMNEQGTQDGEGSISFTLAIDGGDPLAITVDRDRIETHYSDDVDDILNVTADELAHILNTEIAVAMDDGATVPGDIDPEDVVEFVSVNEAGSLTFTSQTEGSDSSISISDIVIEDGATGWGISEGDVEGADVAYAQRDLADIITEINTNFGDALRATNDDGQLRVENLSTQTLEIEGATSGGVIDGSTSMAEIGGNQVRGNLAGQFNELRDQLDKLADDASFNGINLLQGDQLTLTFNETGTSSIDIQTQSNEAVNSLSMNIMDIDASELDRNTDIDGLLGRVSNALESVRSQASAFGSNLSIVENRTEFTKNMMNTLQTGADNLVLADTNEEGANMLALQTRQQLSSVALSMASQADQAVLRLF